jgi:hypothetical protein
LVEELRLLLDAVADRAGPWLDRVAGPPGEHTEPAGGQGRCPVCPVRPVCLVCLVLALLRGEPSEPATRGLERAADLVALVRAVLADRWEPGVPHMPGFRPPPREPARVQRIPVRRKGRPG